ncbi:hypothetical protein V6N13_062893 [Hibiscus sabdariffa]|uniref:Uncharacterized protein n=1 Tax=Hibiscus sabdariffa TaxID=183260 RepID=A0ABR2ND89_9ROSI
MHTPDYNSYQYDSAPWYGAYEPEFGHPNVAYSSYTFSEPNYVEAYVILVHRRIRTSQSLNNFSYGSIELPDGKRVDEPVEKPSNGSKAAAVEDREQRTQGRTEDVNAGSNDKLTRVEPC